jgi:integrase
MGLYKLCQHKGRARDRCEHAWWASYQHRGRLYRASLERWANVSIGSKTEAETILDRFREAVRDGSFSSVGPTERDGPLTFARFAAIYIERYVKANGLASGDTIEYRMAPILEHFGQTLLAEVKTADVEDFIAKLKEPARLAKHELVPRVRRPATINRYLSLLRHMFNWAIGREYIECSPFRRGTQALIRQEHEDNRRHRRINRDEEQQLLDMAPEYLRPMIVTALDAGLRRGEMLALTWADVDARPGWLRLRGETTKSGKTRWVPVATLRLAGTLEFLRLDADGNRRVGDSAVFANEHGEPVQFPEAVWHSTILRAHGIQPRQIGGRKGGFRLTDECRAALRRIDLHWHDLRHEYASRLVECGVPLSQVRDLLGHASIVTTERYDNQRPEALFEAAKRLETGEPFKNLSSSGSDAHSNRAEQPDEIDGNLLNKLKKKFGVDDGIRTRDSRSHSPELYP